MAHIDIQNPAPGIGGLFQAYPETAVPLRLLAETLLRGPSPLSSAEREIIATAVSHGNGCHFCTESHAAAARELLGDQAVVMDEVLKTGRVAGNEKLSALLAVAELVRQGGKEVSEAAIAKARESGADDPSIHHTVLIAAAFCMFNRYVDGLGTTAPQEPAEYLRMGAMLAASGYIRKARTEGTGAS